MIVSGEHVKMTHVVLTAEDAKDILLGAYCYILVQCILQIKEGPLVIYINYCLNIKTNTAFNITDLL
jgi:hypothetical protein